MDVVIGFYIYKRRFSSQKRKVHKRSFKQKVFYTKLASEIEINNKLHEIISFWGWDAIIPHSHYINHKSIRQINYKYYNN